MVASRRTPSYSGQTFFKCAFLYIYNFLCHYLFLQLKMNVQQHIMPQLQDLYHFLERDFSPLKLCARVNVFFEFLLNNEELELSDYVKPLQEVSIARLLKQVSHLAHK